MGDKKELWKPFGLMAGINRRADDWDRKIRFTNVGKPELPPRPDTPENRLLLERFYVDLPVLQLERKGAEGKKHSPLLERLSEINTELGFEFFGKGMDKSYEFKSSAYKFMSQLSTYVIVKKREDNKAEGERNWQNVDERKFRRMVAERDFVPKDFKKMPYESLDAFERARERLMRAGEKIAEVIQEEKGKRAG